MSSKTGLARKVRKVPELLVKKARERQRHTLLDANCYSNCVRLTK